MKRGLFVALSLLSAVSCMKVEPSLQRRGRISLGVQDMDFRPAGPETKVSDVFVSMLEASGFMVNATTGTVGSEAEAFTNVLFSKDGSVYTGQAYWPAVEPAGGFHFYASNVDMSYAPTGATVSASNGTDVVCAYLESPDYGVDNVLSFTHIFSRLKSIIVVPEEGYTVSDVSIRLTPKTGGVYDIRAGAGHTDGTGWSSVVTGTETEVASTLGTNLPDLGMVPGHYTLKVSWRASVAGLYDEVFTDKEVEVDFRSGAKSIIRFTVGGDADLSWVELSVDNTSITYDRLGVSSGSTEFNVTSVYHGLVSDSPTPWRTMVRVDGSWVPLSSVVSTDPYLWLTGFPTGEADPASLVSSYSPAVPATEVTSHEERLRSLCVLDETGSSPVDNSTAENAVDLSKYDFMTRRVDPVRYTANCYVLSSPGWYKFPLIYGNAIENGATKTMSYKSSKIGLGHLDGFKNYKYDLSIAEPWIENDWYSWLIRKNHVESLTMLWLQFSRYDESTSTVITQSGSQGVVSNVSIITEADGRYVRFHISEENIRPGNFLIAAKDAGGDTEDEEGDTSALTMWSWHIWVTDQTMTPVAVSNGTNSYEVLPVNVGWVDGTKGQWYAPRSAELCFESLRDPSVRSAVVTVTQTGEEVESVTGWGPYYQWGRKDPFVLGLYTFAGNYDTGLRGSIRYPARFNSEVSTYFTTQYYDWLTNNYNNMWDTEWNTYGSTSGALPTSKTVMDPSPRKFCVSPDLAWDGFASYGHDGDYDGGYHFYTNSSRSTTIFFPACGYIGYDGILNDSGDNRYWTLHPWQSLQRRASYGLRFGPSSVETEYYNLNHRAYGQQVRPVKCN